MFDDLYDKHNLDPLERVIVDADLAQVIVESAFKECATSVQSRDYAEIYNDGLGYSYSR